MTPEAAAGILTAGGHSHASPAVAPAHEGGAAAAERAGTGGCSRRGGRGARPALPRRLGIPTPKTDNFLPSYSLAAILAATLSHAALVFSDLALAAPASASSSPGSISRSSARATACSSSGTRRLFRQSLTAALVTPMSRAVSLSFFALPWLMASSRYRAMGFIGLVFRLRPRIIFCTLTVDKMYAQRVRFICTPIANKITGEIKSEC